MDDFVGHLKRLKADVLTITPQHAIKAGALPLHHRDAFDRMLIAQSQLERVAIVTNDALMAPYQVELEW